MMKVLVFAILSISIVLMLYRTVGQQMGARLSLAEKTNFISSANYQANSKRFANNHAYNISQPKERSSGLNALKSYMQNKDKRPPCPLPTVEPNLTEFCQPSDDIKFIWLGHSTLLINFAGYMILLDPVFANTSAPVSFITKRFQPPAIDLDSLPTIDFIVLSHDHYDHLDMQTIKFFKDKQTKFVTPLGVGTHLRKWGIETSRITELDWWQELQIDSLEFILTPAQHFSGRGLFDHKHTLWGSWVICNQRHKIYFSGDSGYAKHFSEIATKYGPFDLAFVENGQYDPAWNDVHMLPNETIQAMLDLNSKVYVPIHWGAFCLAPHNWYDPIENIHQLSKLHNIELYTPKLGEIVHLGNYDNKVWWQEFIPNKTEKEAKIIQGEI